MSYNDSEISDQDGVRAALYTLAYGSTVWRYTSADRDIVREELVDDVLTEVTYVAVACSDDGMVQGGSSNNDLTIHIPSNLPIVDLFRSTPPTNSIDLTVRRIHWPESDSPIYWIGTVGNVQREEDPASALVIGRTLTASFNRTGLRLCWTRGCPFALYDQDCKLDPEDFRVEVTITALTGTTVTTTSPAKAAGYFDGGMISWIATDEGTVDRRSIESSVSATQFTIFGSTDRMHVGDVVGLYPGCDLIPETCNGKFANMRNYGGFKQMSGKSPFDGTPVF